MIPSPHRSCTLLVLVLAFGLLLSPYALADDKPATPPAPAKAAEKTAEKSAPAPRTPMLWEVDTKPKIYLFGTIHVGDPRVLAHPPVVKKALAASQALYTEIEMDPASLMQIAPLMRLPEGQSLKTLLPPKLRDRVRALFKAKGLPDPMLDAFDGLQIWAIYLQLQTLDIDPKLMAQALDKVLYEGAQKAGKTVGALETMREQIDIFATLTTKEQISLLEQTVDAIEKARKEKVTPIEKLLQLYLTGDADLLYRSMAGDMDKGDALSKKLMKRMLDDRNVRMVERMLKKAQSHPDKTTFVAVGAGHYPGPMGIIELLRKTGFRVRQLETAADFESAWPLKWRTCRPSRAAPKRRGIRVGPFCLPDPCGR